MKKIFPQIRGGTAEGPLQPRTVQAPSSDIYKDKGAPNLPRGPAEAHISITEPSCKAGTPSTEPPYGSAKTAPNQTEHRTGPDRFPDEGQAHTTHRRPSWFGQPRLPNLSLGSAQIVRHGTAFCLGPHGSALTRFGQYTAYTAP